MWRASSLVECINSVARMHQGRHRKMTQGLLDLKRLYWNLHQFRAGHRKNQTPYGLLGLKLPALSFWEFLRMRDFLKRGAFRGVACGQFL